MIYRFTDCEIDTRLLELRRRGEVQRLDPLGFDLLVYLLDNRDRVVTRNELLDVLWPGKVVTDSALSSRLKHVRSAVGDTGSAQSIIKTVHGRGYRFVAELASAEPAPGKSAQATGHDVVGREAELGKLHRWQQRSDGGFPELIIVRGDPGVGKTTLTRAFLQRLDDEATLILQGQCVNQRTISEAYLPLLEALNRAGQGDANITGLLRQYAPDWLVHLPALHGTAVDFANYATVSPARMMREFSDLLVALSQERSVVMLLEDLHWSDPSTLGWLDYHARRNDSGRLMVICTARPEGPHRAVTNELVTRHNARLLELQAIDEALVSDYLQHRLGHPTTPELAALVFRRTGGFPLFIEALLERWLGEGSIERTDGLWHAAHDDEQLLAGVPESLAQLIDEQLDVLDDESQQLLETASMGGCPFAAAAVAAAVERPEEEVEAKFSRLARRGGMVIDAGEQWWPDGTATNAFEFRHDLYREALYERVPASRRVRLHGRLGDRLEKAYGDQPGSLAAQIAEHFAQAHEVDKALHYFHNAATTAFSRSANRETFEIVDRALQLVPKPPADPDMGSLVRTLHLLRASALGPLQGWGSKRVEESYRIARQIGETLDLDTSPEIIGIAAIHEVRGYYEDCESMINELMEGHQAASPEALELLACSLFHQGRFEDSKNTADRGSELYDPGETYAILARYGENAVVCCHGWAAMDLWFMGFSDAALSRSDIALELASEHTYSLATALTQRTFLHQFRNEPELTAAWADRAVSTSAEEGYGFRIAQATILGGWARGQLATSNEQRRTALEYLDKGISRYRQCGAKMDVAYFLTLRADTLMSMSEIQAAREAMDEAFALCGTDRGFFYEAEMRRLYARLMLASNARQAAAKMLERAVDVAHAQNARFLQLRASVSRMKLLDGNHGRGAYREDLQRQLASLAEGHETPDWQQASALAATEAAGR